MLHNFNKFAEDTKGVLMTLSWLLFYNIEISNRFKGTFDVSKHRNTENRFSKNTNLYLVRQNGSVQIEKSCILEKVGALSPRSDA